MRHFYWAVTSTQECLGQVKLAKFQAFLSHVTNKHKELPDRLFNANVPMEILSLQNCGCPKVHVNEFSKKSSSTLHMILQ